MSSSTNFASLQSFDMWPQASQFRHLGFPVYVSLRAFSSCDQGTHARWGSRQLGDHLSLHSCGTLVWEHLGNPSTSVSEWSMLLRKVTYSCDVVFRLAVSAGTWSSFLLLGSLLWTVSHPMSLCCVSLVVDIKRETFAYLSRRERSGS